MAEENSIQDDPNPFFDEGLFSGGEEPEPEPEPEPARETLSPQELTALRQQASVAQRFSTDPDFARRFIMEGAQRLGLQVQEPQREPQGPPPDYVAKVAGSLSEELKFLAPQIAAASWTANQAILEPVLRRNEAQDAQQKQATYDSMAKELSGESPGWEQYEDTMLEILSFLRGAVSGSGSMNHPKYGSALKLLYRLASGDAQASATAGRRMQAALRSGTRTSSGGGRGPGPDLETMISKAKTSQQKWGLAFQNALREHGVT